MSYWIAFAAQAFKWLALPLIDIESQLKASTMPIYFTNVIARYRGPTVNLVDQGIVSAANFLTVVLLARNFSLVAFGVFMMAQTLLTLLTNLQNALVTQPHNILGAQREGTAYAQLTLILGWLQIVLSIGVTLIVATGGLALLLGGNNEYAHLAFALAAIVLPWMAQEFIRRVLYTQGDAVGAALNNFVSYGLQVAGVVAVVQNANGIATTPANALLALGVSSFIATLFGIGQLRKHAALRALSLRQKWFSPRLLIANYAEVWRLSKWLLAQQSAAWFGASGTGWILTAFLGPASFGIYRAAYQVVNILNPLRQAAMNHLPSRAARVFSQRGVKGLTQWTRSVTLTLTIPFALLALTIVFVAQPLANLFYGHMQLPNLHFIVAMGALTFTINFVGTPLVYAVLVRNGGRSLFLRALWLAAFVLTGGVALIWSFGIFGALLSEVLTAILALALTLRVYLSKAPANKSQETLTPGRAPELRPEILSVGRTETCLS